MEWPAVYTSFASIIFTICMILLSIVLLSLILSRYVYCAIISGSDVKIRVNGLYRWYKKAIAMAIEERKNWNGISQAKLKIHTFSILLPELKEMAPAVNVVFRIKNI